MGASTQATPLREDCQADAVGVGTGRSGSSSDATGNDRGGGGVVSAGLGAVGVSGWAGARARRMDAADGYTASSVFIDMF